MANSLQFALLTDYTSANCVLGRHDISSGRRTSGHWTAGSQRVSQALSFTSPPLRSIFARDRKVLAMRNQHCRHFEKPAARATQAPSRQKGDPANSCCRERRIHPTCDTVGVSESVKQIHSTAKTPSLVHPDFQIETITPCR